MNTIWILSDQHNANCLGSAGHPDVRTPHLDRLAAQGMRFESAYCNNPICGPSRCSMITGRHPWRTGITGNRVRGLTLSNPGTVSTLLRASGYQTALIGKSHMPSNWDHDGFEYRRYCDLCDADGGDPRKVDYFRFLESQGLADAYDLGTRFPGEPGYLLERFTSRIPLKASLETWTGDEAVKFLRERRDDRPYFLLLSFQRPHEPLGLPPEIADWYDPDKLHLPDSAIDFFERGFEGKPAFQQEYVRGGTMGYPYRPRNPDDLKRQLAAYYSLITLIDQQIGRVLEALRETGEDEETMVIYNADHGDFAGEHGLNLKNLGLYESIHRVPLILRHPDIPAGSTCDSLVELVDPMPTILQAAGKPVPADLDGISLLETARGTAPERKATVCLYDFNHQQPCSIAVRTRRHRLVTYPWQPDVIGELYDHETDPGELENLWTDPTQVGVRLDLTQHALAAISRFERRWSTVDDGRPEFSKNPTPAQRLQERGATWSQIEDRES